MTEKTEKQEKPRVELVCVGAGEGGKDKVVWRFQRVMPDGALAPRTLAYSGLRGMRGGQVYSVQVPSIAEFEGESAIIHAKTMQRERSWPDREQARIWEAQGETVVKLLAARKQRDKDFKASHELMKVLRPWRLAYTNAGSKLAKAAVIAVVLEALTTHPAMDD